MKIHRITLSNVRGVSKLEFDQIPDTGFILIVGPNERGKSTVMEAVHMVLFHKHNSKRKEIKALQPVGRDVGSTITLEATVGPYRFEISKTFNKQVSAQLRVSQPTVDNRTGEDAEQELARILGHHLDQNLFNALFVRQGELTNSLKAAGIPSLTAALSNRESTGTQVQGTENTGLVERVEQEYLRYFTASKGAVTGELKTAQQVFDQAEEERSAAQRQVEELASYVNEVAHLQAKLAAATERIPALKQEISQREQKSAEAAAARARLDKARDQMKLAELAAKQAAAAWKRRSKSVAEMQQLADRLSSADAQLRDKKTDHAELTRVITNLKEEHAALQEKRDREAEKVANYDRALTALDDAARLAELHTLIEAVEQLDQRIKKLTDLETQTVITREVIEQAEQAVQAVVLATAQRDAQSTVVELSSPSDTTISVNGQPQEVDAHTRRVEVTDVTTMDIAGVQVRVVPGQSHQKANRELAQHEQQLSAVLKKAGCESLAELKSRHREQQEQRSQLKSLCDQRTAALHGRDLAVVQAQVEQLSASVDRIVVLGSRDECERGRSDALADYQCTLAAVEKVHNKLEVAQSNQLVVDIKVLEAQREAVQEQYEAISEALATARAELDDEQVREHKRTAAVEYSAAAQEVDRIGAEIVEQDYDAAERLLQGARNALKEVEVQVGDMRTRIAQYQGRIEQSFGAEERRDVAQAAVTVALSRLEAVRRRADAARLLRQTLQDHRDRAQRRYAAPFADRLARYARLLFGQGVHFELDDDLQVTRRVVGDEAIELPWLSGGAQEQLAVLTRLAIADLVGVGKESVPVFVDDVLGNTDEGRLASLAVVFSEVSKDKQVFVLSCMPDRYIRVDNKKKYEVNLIKDGM